VETGHCVWCVSGAKTERVQLRRILDQLDAGDVFARDQGSTAWRAPPARLAIPRADTTTPHGRLMLTVLADLAEFERGLIRGRARGALCGC
jgi:Resolvase, N terminal domain